MAHDIFACADAQQLFRRYSDSELLAIWQATETWLEEQNVDPAEGVIYGGSSC